jgi:hypothetical protein
MYIDFSGEIQMRELYLREIENFHCLKEVRIFINTLRGTHCMGPYQIDDLASISEMLGNIGDYWGLIFGGPHDPKEQMAFIRNRVISKDFLGLWFLENGVVTIRRKKGIVLKMSLDLVVFDPGGLPHAVVVAKFPNSELGEFENCNNVAVITHGVLEHGNTSEDLHTGRRERSGISPYGRRRNIGRGSDRMVSPE